MTKEDFEQVCCPACNGRGSTLTNNKNPNCGFDIVYTQEQCRVCNAVGKLPLYKAIKYANGDKK